MAKKAPRRTAERILEVTLEKVIAAEPIEKKLEKAIRDGLAKAQTDRAGIRALALSDDTGEKRRLLDEANAAVGFARRLGDALVDMGYCKDTDVAKGLAFSLHAGAGFRL